MRHQLRGVTAETAGAPSPTEVREAREAAGLTQTAAAQLVGLRARERWTEYESGKRRIGARTWELFKIKTKREVRQ